MPTTKVRRVWVSARLSVDVRSRLTKYAAASGISERTILEDALHKYLNGADDTAMLLRRITIAPPRATASGGALDQDRAVGCITTRAPLKYSLDRGVLEVREAACL